MADPDLRIRGGRGGGGGGGHPDPDIRGGTVSKKKILPFGPHFGLKIRGETGTTRPLPPLDLPLRQRDVQKCKTHV